MQNRHYYNTVCFILIKYKKSIFTLPFSWCFTICSKRNWCLTSDNCFNMKLWRWFCPEFMSRNWDVGWCSTVLFLVEGWKISTSELSGLQHYSKVLGPSANLVVTPDKQPKLATFVVLHICSSSLSSETRYKLYGSHKIQQMDWIGVNIGFHFDVAARGGAVCWQVFSSSRQAGIIARVKNSWYFRLVITSQTLTWTFFFPHWAACHNMI